MMGCLVSRQCADACLANESSQHPMCPHAAQRRKCTHQPPIASHSTHPAPLGGTEGSMAALMQASLPVLERIPTRLQTAQCRFESDWGHWKRAGREGSAALRQLGEPVCVSRVVTLVRN